MGIASKVSVLPACVDIEVVRGTDNTLLFVIADSRDKAINITNDDIVFTVKEKYSTPILIQKTSPAGSHYDSVNGQVQFIIDKEDIDDEVDQASVVYWLYEIRRIVGNPTNDENVHIYGKLIIHPTVGLI